MEYNFDEIYQKYARVYNLDWKMLKAIATIESNEGEHPRVARGLASPTDIEGSKSSDGKSWGIMQVTLTTARDYDRFASEEKLNNPDYSVSIAAQHLHFLEGIFNRNDPRFREWVIKSYNQGQGNTQKEMNKVISGYAGTYWSRYRSAYNNIDGI